MTRLYELWLPLVLIAVSIPLVMRRCAAELDLRTSTTKTMSNPQIWYEAIGTPARI